MRENFCFKLEKVLTIISHENLGQKHQCVFVFFKVLVLTFCVGVKTKRPTRNLVCVPETAVRGVWSFLPTPLQTKMTGTVLEINYFVLLHCNLYPGI